MFIYMNKSKIVIIVKSLSIVILWMCTKLDLLSIER